MTVSKKILWTVVIIFVTLIIQLFVDKVIKGYIIKSDRFNNKNDVKNPIPFIIVQIINVILMIIAVMSIMNVWGFNVTSLLAGLGIAGAVIGLALQDTIKDIFMGAHLYKDKFFTTGDYIMHGDEVCKVLTFSLRTTKMQTLGGCIISVPNREITEVVMAPSVYKFRIPVSYEEDKDKVRDVLSDIADEIRDFPNVTDVHFPGIFEFADSAVIYLIVAKTTPDKVGLLRFRGNNLIMDKLTESGIMIPYNQLDVHVREGLQNER